MKTSEILSKAADIIEAQGWTKGEQGTVVGDGPKCLMGSVGQAAGVTTFNGPLGGEHYSYNGIEEHPAGLALREHMGLLKSERLYSFNDQTETSEDDVLEVLRAAALIEAAREAYADPLQLGMARLGVYEDET